MKILFYTDIPRSFKSNLAAYAKEISKAHELVLLTEESDQELRRALPGIRIIEISQFSTAECIIAKNRRLSKLAEKIIKEENPDIVIAQGDYFFESYLRKEARKKGIITLSAMGPFFVNNLKDFVKYRYYISAKGRGVLSAKIKKSFAHFLYYWILPLTAGRLPFIGHESCVLWNPVRKKGADFYFVYSEKDRRVLENSGADISNVLVLAHPLSKYLPSSPEEKTITIMEDGKPYLVDRNDFSLISEEKRREYKKEVVKTVAEILNDWKIYVKPHPKDSEERVEQIKEDFAGLAKIVGRNEPANDYIEKSAVTLNYVAGMTVFSSILMKRPVIAVDWQKEFMADFYKDSEEVEYASDKEELKKILNNIKLEDYKTEKSGLKNQGFSSILDLLNFIKNEYRK
jgi:hypothetical protein